MEVLAALDQALADSGCTRYLATTMSASRQRLEAVLGAVASFKQIHGDSGLAGVHLEGPFIHPGYAGAQGAEFIRDPDLAELQSYCARFPSLIRRVTLAPELPEALSLIAFCRQVGITVSAGHSGANFSQATEAFNAGAQQVTHLFNAMAPMHHREPGLAGAALQHPQVMVEVIADGVHLHPAAVRLAARLKGPDQVMLATDAMRAAGLGDGTYELGGQSIVVANGVARTSGQNLAGSTLTMLQAVFGYQAMAGVDLVEAVRAASLVPAQAVGLADRGALKAGFCADFLLVHANGSNRMTCRNGKILYDGR